MARARNLKPSFFMNETLAECDPLARLLFAGLWTIADREGRLEDRPKKIKAELLPYDDCNCESLLSELHRHGFILRYVVGESRFIQVVNFNKHQNPHVKEAESTIPAQDSPGASTIQAGPLPSSPFPLPDSPIPLPPCGEAAKKPPPPALTLEQKLRAMASEEKIAKFTAYAKEHGIVCDVPLELEKFTQYCLSGKGKYTNHIAGFYNWLLKRKDSTHENNRRHNGSNPAHAPFSGAPRHTDKPTWQSEADRLIAKYEQQARLEGEGLVDGGPG